MNFIKHSNLSGHAPFSPSQPAWLRYDDDKAIKYLIAKKASERGTKLDVLEDVLGICKKLEEEGMGDLGTQALIKHYKW